MVMDEETLEESITDYKQQLNQIDILLESCAEEESKIELMQLREDLGQLISITEDSLLSFKKSKLLQLLSESNDNDEYNTPEESDDATEIDGKDEKEEVDIMGLKCRAPFTFEWGGAEYHNAMIFCKEDVEDLKDEDENEKVRVLFLNPTHMSMLPCSFFMDGKCKFSEEECRYSHGQIVNIADLEDYREPDFSLISIDGQCLAKYEDGIWYKATVRDIEEDQITVHYDTYNEEMVLDLHSLLPVETKDNVSSSDDSSISDEENLQDGDFIADLSWRPSTNGAPLGEWEAHTKGFGSKLMASMGYIFGKGLGKDGQGRVEPVEITLLPAGKSLDKIAELREQGKLRKPGRRKKKKKLLDPENTNTIPGSSYKSSGDQGSDVFQFINSKLHSKANSSSEPTDARPRYNLKDSYKELKRTMNRKKKGESSQSEKGKYYNIQSYKSYEQLSAVKKKLVKQKEALSRNLGKDETMASALRRNIKSTEEEIDKLEKNDQIISQRINSKSQSRKLAIF